MTRAAVACVGALVAFSACDTGDRASNYLEGSLGQVMDLGYDEVRINIAPEDVSLLFVRKQSLSVFGQDAGTAGPAMSEDYPVIVAYRFYDSDPMRNVLPAAGTLDLTTPDENGNQRGVLSRNVSGDPRTTFPPIRVGALTFDHAIEAGATIHGDFHVTFENGVELASGRTVFVKAFTATVQP